MAYTLTFDNSITPYVNGKPGTSGMKLHNGDTISVSWQYFWLKVNGKDYEGYGETITITDSNINLSEGAYSSDFDAASLTINFVDTSVVHVSVDLTTLAGWEGLSSGTHNITIVAKANGFKDSAPSAAVQVEKAAAMPVKGDIITMDTKQYRVLKVNGSVAEVLCMYDANSSIQFDGASSGRNNTYAGKNIDTYCNNTFYSGLSSAMKSAIVDKAFTQDSWGRTTSVPTTSHYTGKYGSSTYYLTLANAAFGTSITRHCYCLSVQDVLDYLEATTSMEASDTTLTDTNVWKMFWNVTTSQSNKYIWLRSAYSSVSDRAFYVFGRNGGLLDGFVDSTCALSPAFQIDLSKVEWSK